MYSLVIDMDVQSHLSLPLWKNSFHRSLSSLLKYCHHDVLSIVLRCGLFHKYFFTTFKYASTPFLKCLMSDMAVQFWCVPETADWLMQQSMKSNHTTDRTIMWQPLRIYTNCTFSIETLVPWKGFIMPLGVGTTAVLPKKKTCHLHITTATYPIILRPLCHLQADCRARERNSSQLEFSVEFSVDLFPVCRGKLFPVQYQICSQYLSTLVPK